MKSVTTIFPSKDFHFFFAVSFLGFIQREGAYANGFLVNEFNGQIWTNEISTRISQPFVRKHLETCLRIGLDLNAYVCRIWYEDISKIEKAFSERRNISHFWRWEVCRNWYSGFRNQYLSTYIHISTSLDFLDIYT